MSGRGRIHKLAEGDIERSESLRMTGTEDAGRNPSKQAVRQETQNRTQKPAQECMNVRNRASAEGVSATSAALSSSASCAQKTPGNKGFSPVSGGATELPGTGVEPARGIILTRPST